MSTDVSNVHDEDIQGNGPETHQSDDVCSICLESIKNCSSINSCTHLFCFDCIYRWSKVSNTCPLCQSRFTSLTRLNEEEKNDDLEEQNNKKRKRPLRSAAVKANKKLKGNKGRIRIPFRDTRRQDDIEDYRSLIAQFFNHNRFVHGNHNGTFSGIYIFPTRRNPQQRIFIDLTGENEENRNMNFNNNHRNEVICIDDDDDDSDIEVQQPNHYVINNIEDDNDDIIIIPMHL